ncbi:hypothetical protein OG777_10580 [Micromonospora peucetia]|uniref:hypothetical protein n=1 Tax=Micromonospora peucetia TaxID=47871 RepID=UPI002251A64A|nr:hypothetical protein [Micromonospora peucetia]MCX4387378.1 hypothetical protein [Micromonospora peucetia]
MGWNTSALFARGEDPLALLSVTATATGALATSEEATSGLAHDVVFVARDQEWQQLWDPEMLHVVDARPGRNTLTVFFSSVSSTYGFSLVNEGVKVRRAVYTNGELTVDDGEPLPIEANIPDPGSDENWVWAIIEHVTGTGYNGNRTFQVYTCPW